MAGERMTLLNYAQGLGGRMTIRLVGGLPRKTGYTGYSGKNSLNSAK